VERAALGRVARSLAIALNNPSMRQVLKAHLRAAPFKEHKVELASYLRRADAGEILAQMASARATRDTITRSTSSRRDDQPELAQHWRAVEHARSRVVRK